MKIKTNFRFLLIINLIILIILSGVSCGKNDTPTAPSERIYNLRDTGPAGGLIFYDKGSYSDGWRYLEAAPQSTEWAKQWGKFGTLVGGTETGIGTGKNNTDLIVSKLNEAPIDSDRAAQLCKALSYGGYSDWFLPSKDELYEMCWVLHSRRWNGSTENNPAYGTNRVGSFDNNWYWSSSEFNGDKAWYQGFHDGVQSNGGKGSNFRIRAIRAF